MSAGKARMLTSRQVLPSLERLPQQSPNRPLADLNTRASPKKTNMAKVTLKNVYKIYAGDKGQDVTAVTDFNLDI